MMKASSRDSNDDFWGGRMRARESYDNLTNLSSASAQLMEEKKALFGGPISFKATESPISFSVGDLSEFSVAPAKMSSAQRRSEAVDEKVCFRMSLGSPFLR